MKQGKNYSFFFQIFHPWSKSILCLEKKNGLLKLEIILDKLDFQ